MDALPERIVVNDHDFRGACMHIAKHNLVALDTEFVGEDTYKPEICLVQIATPEELILIDTIKVKNIEPLWKLLVEPHREVVVHAGREEIRLCQLAIGLAPPKLFDIQIAAGLVGFGFPVGIAQLLQQILNKRINKAETLTDWRIRPLTSAQVRYAFDDVRYLLAAHAVLVTRLKQMDRLEAAQEEFTRLIHWSPDEEGEVGPEKWRRIKGAGQLDRKKLALLKMIFDWREKRASKLNRPARTLLRDDLVIEVAKRMPTADRDLTLIRGLQARDIPDLVEMANQVRKLTPDQCPEPPEKEIETPAMVIASGVLSAVLGDICIRQKLAQSLVASLSEIRAVVRAKGQNKPIPEGLSLREGWRRKLVWPLIEAVLDGKRLLRLKDLANESPIEYQLPEETGTKEKDT